MFERFLAHARERQPFPFPAVVVSSNAWERVAQRREQGPAKKPGAIVMPFSHDLVQDNANSCLTLVYF